MPSNATGLGGTVSISAEKDETIFVEVQKGDAQDEVLETRYAGR
jgi:hypothetical protein